MLSKAEHNGRIEMPEQGNHKAGTEGREEEEQGWRAGGKELRAAMGSIFEKGKGTRRRRGQIRSRKEWVNQKGAVDARGEAERVGDDPWNQKQDPGEKK